MISNYRRVLNVVYFLLGNSAVCVHLECTHTYLPMKMKQSVPKRRHINFKRRGITQKKAYNKLAVLSQPKQLNTDYNHYVSSSTFNPLKPNDAYICRTAPLTSRRFILYIYPTHTSTAYFKHATNSPFFPLQNAVYFIILHFLVLLLFTF